MDRRLSLMEHMMCVALEDVPIIFALTARIEGKFTLAQLQMALSQARKKHPLLSVRVVAGDNGRFHFNKSNVPDALRIVERESAHTWEREVEQEIKTVFDWRTGPLVRFVWVQGETVSELLVVCHHGIADGMSAMYVIHDIMQFLGEPEIPIDPLPMLPPAEQMVSEAVLQKPLVRTKTMLARGAMKLLPLLSRFKKQAPAYDATQEPPDLAFQMISWMLDEGETTAVVQRAKQENTTVHAALSAAFLKAFAAMEGETSGWQRKLSSPVSVRKRLSPPVGEDFGLFITLVETTVNCNPDRDFWEIARALKQKLIRKSVDDKLLFPLAIERHVEPNSPGLELFSDYTNITYDLSITNLGRFNFPVTYGELELKAIFGPVVTTQKNERILGVATVGGQLCFTFVYGQSDMEKEKAEQIRSQAMSFLSEACH